MSILDQLRGGDRRSIGRANEVVEQVLTNPSLARSLVAGMTNADPVVRMRAADVVEKVSARRPELIQPFAARLLDEAAASGQQEVQWHLAQILPRLALTDVQRRRAEAILTAYLEARSSIVKVAALQALTELAAGDSALRARIAPRLEDMARTGSAAVRARGRKLLASLGRAAEAEATDRR